MIVGGRRLPTAERGTSPVTSDTYSTPQPDVIEVIIDEMSYTPEGSSLGTMAGVCTGGPILPPLRWEGRFTLSADRFLLEFDVLKPTCSMRSRGILILERR